MSFSFINEARESLQIIRLNTTGARVLADVLGSGHTYNASTFTGEAWMVAGPSSRCLEIFAITGAGSVTAA